MRVLAYDPYVDPETAKNEALEPVSLADVLRQSDFVSVHCPLNEKTRGLIGARELSRMKSSAILINTARAELVDQKKLLEALQSHSIAGAGIDVYQKEPPLHDPLIMADLPNVVLTPHIGPNTFEVMADMEQLALMNALEIISRHYCPK